jgi:hypothetical protein
MTARDAGSPLRSAHHDTGDGRQRLLLPVAGGIRTGTEPGSASIDDVETIAADHGDAAVSYVLRER